MMGSESRLLAEALVLVDPWLLPLLLLLPLPFPVCDRGSEGGI
jgi:hypothetical protein